MVNPWDSDIDVWIVLSKVLIDVKSLFAAKLDTALFKFVCVTKVGVKLCKVEVELVKPAVALVKLAVALVKPAVALVKPELKIVKSLCFAKLEILFVKSVFVAKLDVEFVILLYIFDKSLFGSVNVLCA